MIVFAVGSTDRLLYRLHISYPAQIHFWRAGVWVPDRLAAEPAEPPVGTVPGRELEP